MTTMSNEVKTEKVYEIQTSARLYFVRKYTGHVEGAVVFRAFFQPINPKTSKPWQSERKVSGGDLLVDGWDWFSTLEKAVEAIETEKNKSGK